jgi:hypothetical protein
MDGSTGPTGPQGPAYGATGPTGPTGYGGTGPTGPTGTATLNYFGSTLLTATGEPQNIPHSIGTVPGFVLVSAQDSTITAGTNLPGIFTVTEGAHNSTFLVIQVVPAGIKYKVLALP